MKSIVKLIAAGCLLVTAGCNNKNGKFDASGTFEADEVIVSATANGKILSLNIEEGSVVAKDSVVGLVDPSGLSLQKEEIEATIESLGQQTADAGPQIRLLEEQLTVQQSKLTNLRHEKTRIENLLKKDAATGKQLDDINAEIDVAEKNINVTQQQINVQRSNFSTQNRGILSQEKPLQKRAAQLEDQLLKARITNPINGTVITKYAEAGEITSNGKALYKVADLSEMILRAYPSASQLSQIKLGQTVKVLVDDGADRYKELPGTITWISDKAEFTPKTIQTKEERANLVYAIKIKVKNDGYLKIGMYGEVKFKP